MHRAPRVAAPRRAMSLHSCCRRALLHKGAASLPGLCQSSSSARAKPPRLQLQSRTLSSSMERASTIEEVMAAIEEQQSQDKSRRRIERPEPWYELLRHPSRAAWRSTDRVFGRADGEGEMALSRASFNMLNYSERTNKQLKRTYRQMLDAQKSLAAGREKERRMAANMVKTDEEPFKKGRPKGSIKDDEGRHIGDWRERNKMRSHPCDDPSVALILSRGLSPARDVEGGYETAEGISRGVRSSPGKARGTQRPVGYGPEHTLANLRYRLGTNHAIVRRVLLEARSLLGGDPPVGSDRAHFAPKRVLDFGCGVGSASAAALDVFGASRNDGGSARSSNGIDWIHSVDVSRPMREAAEKVLTTVLEDAPWEPEENEDDETAFNEELAGYERMMRRIKGEPNPKTAERRRKRMQKWEQTWKRREDHRTRLTFGESIVDSSSSSQSDADCGGYDGGRPALPWQKQLDEQRRLAAERKGARATSDAGRKSGSFDLVLCAYTLSEMPNVGSALAAAALLWEKLAPDGVLVFVEPGTPDGFSALRSVRSMLIECCPPPEIREARRRASVAAEAEKEGNGSSECKENVSDGHEQEPPLCLDPVKAAIHGNENVDAWHEECHVIAPCTHNGTCPMSRHRREHVKNTRFDRYESATKPGVDKEEDDDKEGEEEEESGSMLSDWGELSPAERQELKILSGMEDADDEDLEEMMKLLDENEDGEEEDEDVEEESDSDDEYDIDENGHGNYGEEYFEIEANEEDSSPKSTMTQTDVFNASFCSFVHGFPNDIGRKRGEKFSYLVVQKRNPGEGEVDEDIEGSFSGAADCEFDVTEMLARSIYHSRKAKEEYLENSRRPRSSDEDYSGGEDADTYHMEQSREILQKAVEAEDSYLESDRDGLGLDFLTGDARRRSWGRLFRAPLKRKGHIVLDYCSAGCAGGGTCDRTGAEDISAADGGLDGEGTRGRIIRQKVSRGWSARTAPGCHAAARKARWGGLWPDTSGRFPARDEEGKARSLQKMDGSGS